jgi:hypothetical protein
MYKLVICPFSCISWTNCRASLFETTLPWKWLEKNKW